jgi:hypothetical protein
VRAIRLKPFPKSIGNSQLATGAEQCQDGGWMTFTSTGVKHEGACVGAMARA